MKESINNKPSNQTDVTIHPKLLEAALRNGHDFTASVFTWEDLAGDDGPLPVSAAALVRDGEVTAVIHEADRSGWIASDFGGSLINRDPVTRIAAEELAVRSALLLFAPGRPTQ